MHTKINTFLVIIGALAIGVIVNGCAPVHPMPQASNATLQVERTIVFVRPDEHTLLGTRSLSDYIEVVYEHSELNNAGLLDVKVGLRNRGGQHLWDRKGRNINISLKCVFYNKPELGDQRNYPLYETNWRTLRLIRGAITDLSFICPKKGAEHYQVILSEIIGSTR